MKRLSYFIVTLVTFLVFSVTIMAQTLTPISDWGFVGNGGATRTGGWSFAPSTTAGNGGVAGTQSLDGNWCAIKGGFNAITPTNTQAIVVTGKIQFVGSGPIVWSGLRYGLFNMLTPGTLQNAGTATAAWSGNESSNGYMFIPHSGTTDQVGWSDGGNGTQGVIRGAAWLSTFGNAHRSLGVITQKPARAEMTAGTYNFAISVRPLPNNTNEITYYIVKDDNKFWTGGTVIDTEQITTTYNSVCFAIQGKPTDTNADMRAMNLIDVKVGLGNPVVVPEAPWVDYYVEDWGFIGNKGATRTGGWDFAPSDVYGNAGVKGTKNLNGSWSAIRGQFKEPITPTVNKALIVTGKMQFVGAGPKTWSGLRYGIFMHDSAGVLEDTNKATAYWTGKESDAWGYMFTPHSGTNDQVGWANGNGTQGVIRGGAWLSTFGNAHQSLGVVNQAPARAEMTAGIYNFAISVRPLTDGTSEVKWYIIKDDNSYWSGGTSIDNEKITTKYNGLCFALNGGNGAENSTIREMNLIDVKVSMGNPIIIPEAPWVDYYVEDWGFIGNKGATRTGGWKFEPGEVYGNAGIVGTKPLDGNWAAIRGQFREPIKPTTSKALVVTGKITFVGSGPIVWSGLRYGLFMHDSAGVLKDTNKATAYWTGKESDAKGYMFTPHSGTNDQVGWANGNGTHGVIRGGAWISTFGNAHSSLGVVNQAPARAEMKAGTYNFAFSVRPLSDGTNEVKWYIIKDDNSYWSGGTSIDTEGITATYNGLCFAIQGKPTDTNADMRAMRLQDVKLSLGNPITIPNPPFKAYYVDAWGIYGNRTGGWTFTPGEVIGNATVSGTEPLNNWVAVRGGFIDAITPTTDKALIVTGRVEFAGGGFDLWSSLRYGVFFSENPGNLVNNSWSGTEDKNSGYLFLPQSGTDVVVPWVGINKYGTWGGIVNNTWFLNYGTNDYVLGNDLQKPKNAVAKAGIYDFAISIQPKSDGTREIRHYLIKTDNAYYWAGTATDNHTPLVTTKFNSVAFALHTNPKTTAMKFYDVKVDLGNPIVIPPITSVDDVEGLPTEFVLNQNYPNPFNPTTTIEFAMPKSGEVSLVVYDILGRVVKELVSGIYEAGYHKVNFNATNFASGIYFYKLKAGDFVSVKKLTLLK